MIPVRRAVARQAATLVEGGGRIAGIEIAELEVVAHPARIGLSRTERLHLADEFESRLHVGRAVARVVLAGVRGDQRVGIVSRAGLVGRDATQAQAFRPVAGEVQLHRETRGEPHAQDRRRCEPDVRGLHHLH